MKTNKYNLMRGFTLLEALIAVLIFMIVFLIAASFVNLATGSLKSNRTKLLTNDIRNVFDTINLKMNNANQWATYGDRWGGYRLQDDILGNEILGIFSTTDGTNTTCTFFGKNGTSLAMLEGTCPPTWPAAADLNQNLTGPNVRITNDQIFSLPGGYVFYGGVIFIPTTVNMVIVAEDTDAEYQADNQIKLQTAFTLNYEAINKFKKL